MSDQTKWTGSTIACQYVTRQNQSREEPLARTSRQCDVGQWSSVVSLPAADVRDFMLQPANAPVCPEACTHVLTVSNRRSVQLLPELTTCKAASFHHVLQTLLLLACLLFSLTNGSVLRIPASNFTAETRVHYALTDIQLHSTPNQVQ